MAHTIAVFDSGVGGLSILEPLMRQFPDTRFVYLGDNANLPYGLKTDEELIHIVSDAVTRLCEREPVSLLVIACNTASTLVLPVLRAKFSFPIVGVVPAIKPASAFSKLRSLGLLATPKTIHSPYTDDLIAKFAADCQVSRIGSEYLIHAAEKKLRLEAVNLNEIKLELASLCEGQDFNHPKIDALILGCTHFSWLKPEFEKIFSRSVAIFDSIAAICKRVETLMLELSPAKNTTNATSKIYFTKVGSSENHLQSFVQKLGFERIELL